MKITIITFFITLFFLQSCYEDIEVISETIITEIPPVFVNAHVVGSVMDENGLEVLDATIRLGNQSYSDPKSFFYVLKASGLNQNGEIITIIDQEGKQAYRTIYPIENDINYVPIYLHKSKDLISHDASTTGNYSFSQGGGVHFEANTLSDLLGIYRGEAR